MNKTAIKNFAVNARAALMSDIKQKAYEIGVEATDKILPIEEVMDGFRIQGRGNGKQFKKYQLRQREQLVTEVAHKGLDQVVEEVAYTWFNRLIALRFMEVNEYLPSGVNVLSSKTKVQVEPDILKEAIHLDLDLNKELVYELQDAHNDDELFRYLLVRQCNKLNDILPRMFEKIEDYTELLLPDNLLIEGSVIRDLVESIDEQDFKDQVEIIGWLYQYYISEKKDQVFASLKGSQKITKENIPAATQLFTPKWIVKYMVENSLGKLWLESHPEHSELKAKWKYYIENAEQEPEVQEKLEALINHEIKPEEITFLDPAMGSGHILVYAFDVLYEIYLKNGYSERDIPKLILEKNLFGLDIDDRAGQLAYFALMMKARSKSRRIFREDVHINVMAIQESNHIDPMVVDILTNYKETQIDRVVHVEELKYLVDVFKDAKNFGSILKIRDIDFEAIEARIDEVKKHELPIFAEMVETFLPFLRQAKIISQQYDVVVTNPPYMGRKGMSSQLSNYVNTHYKNTNADLFAVFMDVCINQTKVSGYSASINQHSWMSLNSFEKIRKQVLETTMINSMIHLGARAFEEIAGEVVQSTTYVLKKKLISQYKGIFIRVVDENTSEDKERKTLRIINEGLIDSKFITATEKFSEIPGSPIAYWVSDQILNLYKYPLIGTKFVAKEGVGTRNDDVFLKLFWEVNKNKISSQSRWILTDKAGMYRKWYLGCSFVMDWENDGERIKNYRNEDGSLRSRPQNIQYMYKKGISWGKIGSGITSFRLRTEGYGFNDAAPTLFGEDELPILAALNSKLFEKLLKIRGETLNVTCGVIAELPLLGYGFNEAALRDRALKCVNISKNDWDNYETSWEFKKHPLVNLKTNGETIKEKVKKWNDVIEQQFYLMRNLEEEINQIVIETYQLQNEIDFAIEEKDMSISRVDVKRDILSLISYAIGCIFGRYSLDEDGLIYAGGKFDAACYKSVVPTESNIIAIVDDEYFENDITNRFIDFLRIAYGEESLQENLIFIAETLGMKVGDLPKKFIREYFIKDFFADHCKMYKNRPIYWQFDSGKQGGFKALMYMHRYDEHTVARVRTDYLHTLQKAYDAKLHMLETIIDSEVSARDKADAQKKMDKINKQKKECLEYDPIIGHVANQRIVIDLDDGVKVNYAKFLNIETSHGGKKANILTPIKL